jgi:hypothetical protein
MSKMASHWRFGHLQPKLWAKEEPGVKLAVWLPTAKSRESTWSRRALGECDMPLERSWRGLQDWLDLVSIGGRGEELWLSKAPGVHTGIVLGNFGTPLWESWEKMTFGCGCHGESQNILYGGRWWLPWSPGRGESSESKVARDLSQHQKGAEWVLTNLWLVLMQIRVSE